MKRFILSLGLVVVVLVGIFVAVGLSMPNNYRVERTVVINADRAVLHSYIAELKNWDAWTPWKALDPQMEVTFGDATSGVGATQEWTDQTGGGRLEFTASDLDSGIAYDLFFADFPKVEAGMGYEKIFENSTRVSWWMAGEIEVPVLGGYFASSMEYQVGPMFEDGLKNLKEVVEAVE